MYLFVAFVATSTVEVLFLFMALLAVAVSDHK
jgi:hypothetical protein